MKTLSEHYRIHSRKSLKPYRYLFLLIFMFIAIFHTFGRYSSNAILSNSIELARWSIIINDEQITESITSLEEPIDLINNSNNTTYLEAGDECFFDIVIDPSSTEVAVSYSIDIDLELGINKLPLGTKIEKYEVYTKEGELLTLNNVINIDATSTQISDTINLTNNESLDENCIRKYRVYCILPNDANINNGQIYRINPVITIEQVI